MSWLYQLEGDRDQDFRKSGPGLVVGLSIACYTIRLRGFEQPFALIRSWRRDPLGITP